MAKVKKIVATTKIKHNNDFIEVDEVIDPERFTKEELTRLYERGSVKIVEMQVVEVSVPHDAKKEEVETETKTTGTK